MYSIAPGEHFSYSTLVVPDALDSVGSHAKI